MKTARLLVVILLPTLLFAQNQNKKKSSVPAVFSTARYVWVESMDGDIYNPDLLPADRQAIIDVENALRRWGRYILTANRSDAELIFVVRTGRTAEGKLGGAVGNPGPIANPSQHPIGTGVIVGSEIGPPDDLLKVYLANHESDSGIQVWLRSEDGGLASPDVPLFEELRKAIDRDYPPDVAKKK